jgi:PhnB protein
MASVSTYLNFAGQTEEAFGFYKTVFETEYDEPIMYMRDVPADSMHPLTDAEGALVMHVSMPILGGHRLMGSDVIESFGHVLKLGNRMMINLEPDTRAETRKLFDRLAEGAQQIDTPLQQMFWGDYYGALTDRFGIRWLFNCAEPDPAAA